MKRLLAAVLIFNVCLLAQETAPAPIARDYPDVVAPPRVGISLTQRTLSVEEAIQMALANNLEIEIEKTNRATAEESVRAARGFFDPTFRWVPLFNLQNTPTGSVLQGAGGKLTDRAFGNNFYLRETLPNHGTQLHVDFENSRVSTTNPFTSFNPYLSSRLVLGFTQPLWRNREIDSQRTELKVRQKNVQIAKVDFETRVIDVITRVEQAYWDLLAARADAAVKKDSAAWAREQLAINQRMVKAGTLAPVELAAAEAELERRLDTWYASLETVTTAENNLKTLLASDRNADIWRDEIIPADTRTVPPPPEADDVHAAVTTAIDRRPELRAIGIRQQINDVQKQYAQNQQKPAVDVVAAYSLNGLGGTISAVDNPFATSQAGLYQRLNELSLAQGLKPLPPASFGGPPDLLIGGYGTALSNLFAGRYQSFQAGISIDLNLRNRTADANYAQTVIGERRIKLQQAQIAQAIEAQVRNSLQGIATARQRMEAADASVRAAQEKLASETRLYQTGESTNFLVLTRQNELSDSRARQISAQRDYNKSVSRLQQALGTTLTDNKITLQ